MGSIKIRKVIYEGDNYSFESPRFSDGLQIIEAENGSGKTTFSSLISFGLGIYVPKFNFNSDKEEHHSEIKQDQNNYVQLLIDINNREYIIKRFFGNTSNIILVEENGATKSFDVYRNDGNIIFSDWLLNKLGIPIFDIYQGSKNFKINFWDLSRLIYYDQSSLVHKIFKEHRNSNNFVSDSALVRQTIFQVLLGKGFAEYHKVIGELNKLLKEKESLALALKNIKETYMKMGIDVEKFDKNNETQQLQNLNIREKRLNAYKQSIIAKPDSIKNTNKYLDELKSQFDSVKKANMSLEIEYENLLRELNDLQRLKVTLIDEINQIEKILLTHDKLMLFSINTCPCCLKEISKQENKCICGNDLEEGEYEKFFYTTDEYLTILKSKKKSINTIDNAIESCKVELENVKSKLVFSKKSVNDLIAEIEKLESDETKIIDSDLVGVNESLFKIKSAIEVIQNKLEFYSQFEKINKEFNGKDKATKLKQKELFILESQVNNDFSTQVEKFKSIYSDSLLAIEDSINHVDLNDDYLPIINNGTYKEASLAVLRKIAFYISLLLISVKDSDVLFPKFLLIDTPENLGIDDDKLNKGIGLLNLVYLEHERNYEVSINSTLPFQVILTTGEGKFPPFYSKYVVMKMSNGEKLLKKKN